MLSAAVVLFMVVRGGVYVIAQPIKSRTVATPKSACACSKQALGRHVAIHEVPEAGGDAEACEGGC